MNNKTLRRRFAVILTIYTFLVLGLWFIYHHTAFSYVEKNARENTELAGNYLLAQLNDEFSRMKIVSSVIAGSSYVQEFLGEDDVSAYYEKANAVAEIIRKTTYPQMNVDSIVTVTEDGSFYRFTGGISNDAIEKIYNEVLSAGTPPVYTVLELSGARYFCHISPVYPHGGSTVKPVGHVVMLSNLLKMRRLLSFSELAPDIDTGIILDERVLLAGNPELEGRHESELEAIYGAVSVSQVTGTNLYAVAAVTKEAMFSGERLFLIISAVMLGFLVVTIFLLYRVLSARMITPMLDKAETMRMGLLSTQIDAHFVVNTITSIESLARSGDGEKAAVAAENLAEILKHLHESDKEVNIFEELEILNRYIEIMNIRNEGRFAVDIDVDDRLSEYRMPCQVLQPLVENALTHGLGNKTADCQLMITGKIEDCKIVIVVFDNGAGITEKSLIELQKQLDNADKNDDHTGGLRGVALLNIQKRIRSRYGKPHGIFVSSAVGEGTVVKVILPMVEDK